MSEPLVDVHLLVDPVPTRVADVGLDRRIGGERASADDAGFDQGPRAVANRADRLPLLDEPADEVDGVLVGAKLVRVHHPAGQNERVEVVGVRLLHGQVDRVRRTGLQLLLVQRRDLALLERDERELGAGLLKRLPRLLQLALLVRIRGEECHLLPLQLVRHEPLLSRRLERRVPRQTGTNPMRLGGFEPPTNGLEGRRSVH